MIEHAVTSRHAGQRANVMHVVHLPLGRRQGVAKGVRKAIGHLTGGMATAGDQPCPP